MTKSDVIEDCTMGGCHCPCHAQDHPVIARFTVPGEPVSKQRPRLGKGGNTYTPAKTLDAERRIAWMYRQAARGAPDAVSRFAVETTFHCKSASARDVDNMLKVVLDGLNGVTWADDKQVAKTIAEVLRDQPEPRTEIVISRIEETTT